MRWPAIIGDLAITIAGGSAWVPAPWTAVQRAAWATMTKVA